MFRLNSISKINYLVNVIDDSSDLIEVRLILILNLELTRFGTFFVTLSIVCVFLKKESEIQYPGCWAKALI